MVDRIDNFSLDTSYAAPSLVRVSVEGFVGSRGLSTERQINTRNTIFTFGVYKHTLSGSNVSFSDSFSNECIDRGIAITPNNVFCPTENHPLHATNHSCEANAGPENFGEIIQVDGGYGMQVIALKDIAPGDHICIDYSSVSTKNDGGEKPFNMECLCGSQQCRHNITAFVDLERDLQIKKIREKSVIAHILEEAFFQDPSLREQIIHEYPEHYAIFLKSLTQQRLVTALYDYDNGTATIYI